MEQCNLFVKDSDLSQVSIGGSKLVLKKLVDEVSNCAPYTVVDFDLYVQALSTNGTYECAGGAYRLANGKQKPILQIFQKSGSAYAVTQTIVITEAFADENNYSILSIGWDSANSRFVALLAQTSTSSLVATINPVDGTYTLTTLTVADTTKNYWYFVIGSDAKNYFLGLEGGGVFGIIDVAGDTITEYNSAIQFHGPNRNRMHGSSINKLVYTYNSNAGYTMSAIDPTDGSVSTNAFARPASSSLLATMYLAASDIYVFASRTLGGGYNVAYQAVDLDGTINDTKTVSTGSTRLDYGALVELPSSKLAFFQLYSRTSMKDTGYAMELGYASDTLTLNYSRIATRSEWISLPEGGLYGFADAIIVVESNNQGHAMKVGAAIGDFDLTFTIDDLMKGLVALGDPNLNLDGLYSGHLIPREPHVPPFAFTCLISKFVGGKNDGDFPKNNIVLNIKDDEDPKGLKKGQWNVLMSTDVPANGLAATCILTDAGKVFQLESQDTE